MANRLVAVLERKTQINAKTCIVYRGGAGLPSTRNDHQEVNLNFLVADTRGGGRVGFLWQLFWGIKLERGTIKVERGRIRK